MIDSMLMPKNRFLWMLLAIQGGFINVAGLLSIHLFVSHVTGFSAHFSEALVSKNGEKVFYFLLVPFFFLCGSFFSALFTQVEKRARKTPRYLVVMITLAVIYFIIFIAGHLGAFGDFGEHFSNMRDFILLALLAFSCGGQNALFTHYSNSIIRTTHLTGITTDLGIGLSKYFISKDRKEGKLNRIRIEIILFFLVGSVIGSLIIPKLQFSAFVFPALISCFIGVRLHKSVGEEH